MGGSIGYVCRECGRRFQVRSGGGFYFDLLHCEACGNVRSVSHRDLGDVHLRYVKGLPGPYALARASMDARIQAEYEGEPLDRRGYERAAEETLDPCSCGGRFRYRAPARCPGCRSTHGSWDVDTTAPRAFID